jgi:hypothetical protein
MLKLHKRFPLGNTGLALRVVYDCPLEDLDRALEPPARLLVRLVQAHAQLSQGLAVRACVCHEINIVVQQMPHIDSCSEDDSWSLLAIRTCFHCMHLYSAVFMV